MKGKQLSLELLFLLDKPVLPGIFLFEDLDFDEQTTFAAFAQYIIEDELATSPARDPFTRGEEEGRLTYEASVDIDEAVLHDFLPVFPREAVNLLEDGVEAALADRDDLLFISDADRGFLEGNLLNDYSRVPDFLELVYDLGNDFPEGDEVGFLAPDDEIAELLPLEPERHEGPEEIPVHEFLGELHGILGNSET